jgi:hypothetical protein
VRQQAHRQRKPGTRILHFFIKAPPFTLKLI